MVGQAISDVKTLRLSICLASLALLKTDNVYYSLRRPKPRILPKTICEETGDWLYRRPDRPKGRRMGHARAIISAFSESAAEKVEILQECGVTVVPNPAEFGPTVAKVLATVA